VRISTSSSAEASITSTDDHVRRELLPPSEAKGSLMSAAQSGAEFLQFGRSAASQISFSR
jgi:hypothetical protein